MLKGSINDQNGKYIFIKYEGKKDSTLIKNNSFEFKGGVDSPTSAFISLPNNTDTPWAIGTEFILENSTIFITLHYSTEVKKDKVLEDLHLIDIKGSNSQLAFDNYNEDLIKAFHKEKNDSLKEVNLFRSLNKFLSKNPRLKKSGDELIFRAYKNESYLSTENLEALFELLDTSYQEKKVMQKIELLIQQRKKLGIGKQAPHFKLQKINGEMFNSAQLKADYILIDFWASWCMPCRINHPEMVSFYRTNRGKNFEIVSVSIDKDKKAWQEAVKKDSLDWINVIDTNRVMLKKYFISGIPTSFLIDKNGKILGKNLALFKSNDNKPSVLEILDAKEK
ncbi:hypothetical protein P278_28960 [Zhouia amylolytica AD3]|uniref:Thioredoxin domain-containing protein n=1 Tax=Zhouia amylolytica AD3 TaxID=1286632 RepID=W2UL81_9FLAO|nr:hypothetical protein P278_28960 [Zhouia amylolytica AD3]